MLRQKSEKLVLIVLALVCACFYLSFVYRPLPYSRFNPLQPELIVVKSKFHACMDEAANIYFNDSNKFYSEFAGCIKAYIPIQEKEMDQIFNNVGDERKMFLPLVEGFPEEDCRWLTIGIGGSKTAEDSFHTKYPKCKIFGAEPTNIGEFDKVGTVIPHGVGLEEAEIELSVFDGKKYEIKKRKVLPLPMILDKFIHTRLIHFLTIDIEGYEHIILAELVNNGKFAHEGITFCQIDAELHNPKYKMIHPLAKNLNQVQFILDFLNGTSPYLPIFNIPYTKNPHQKVSFINVIDPECEKAFKFSSYFSHNNK